MKITIAHQPEDQHAAVTALAALLQRFPDAKVRKSVRHPPFRHIYLTTTKPATPRPDGENT